MSSKVGVWYFRAGERVGVGEAVKLCWVVKFCGREIAPFYLHGNDAGFGARA